MFELESHYLCSMFESGTVPWPRKPLLLYRFGVGDSSVAKKTITFIPWLSRGQFRGQENTFIAFLSRGQFRGQENHYFYSVFESGTVPVPQPSEVESVNTTKSAPRVAVPTL